jgi:hypothetical protein
MPSMHRARWYDTALETPPSHALARSKPSEGSVSPDVGYDPP